MPITFAALTKSIFWSTFKRIVSSSPPSNLYVNGNPPCQPVGTAEPFILPSIFSASPYDIGVTGIVCNWAFLGSNRSIFFLPSRGKAGSKGVKGSPVKFVVNNDPLCIVDLL